MYTNVRENLFRFGLAFEWKYRSQHMSISWGKKTKHHHYKFSISGLKIFCLDHTVTGMQMMSCMHRCYKFILHFFHGYKRTPFSTIFSLYGNIELYTNIELNQSISFFK